MNPYAWLRRCAFALPLVALLIAPGCSRSLSTSTVPSDESSALIARDGERGRGGGGLHRHDLFPLSPGNRWEYAQTFQVLDEHGEVVDETSATITDRLVCVQTVFDRTYTIARRTFDYGEGESFTTYIWYRQDRDGLHELDSGGIPACDDAPPARSGAPDQALRRVLDRALERTAPGLREATRIEFERRLGVLGQLRAHAARPGGERIDGSILDPGELTRLEYPLHPRASWTIRETPRFASEVLRATVLETPAGSLPGWDILMTGAVYGPQDEVHVYYGAVGYLGMDATLRGQQGATATRVATLGTARLRERLTGYSLGGYPASPSAVSASRNAAP